MPNGQQMIIGPAAHIVNPWVAAEGSRPSFARAGRSPSDLAATRRSGVFHRCGEGLNYALSRIRTAVSWHPTGDIPSRAGPGYPGTGLMRAAAVPSDDATQGAGMAKRWTGRRVIGAAIALVIVGAIGGTIAMRIVKKINDAPGGKGAEVVVLQFSPADLARVDAQPLSRWLPVSGAVQPLRQATVKAKVFW